MQYVQPADENVQMKESKVILRQQSIVLQAHYPGCSMTNFPRMHKLPDISLTIFELPTFTRRRCNPAKTVLLVRTRHAHRFQFSVRLRATD